MAISRPQVSPWRKSSVGAKRKKPRRDEVGLFRSQGECRIRQLLLRVVKNGLDDRLWLAGGNDALL